MAQRSFFLLLLWSIPGIVAHAQTVYFIDAGTDTMKVGNTYYEVALLKVNGSIASVRNKATGNIVSTGTWEQSVWSCEFFNTASLSSGSYRAGQANSFTYSWNAAQSQLSLTYTPDSMASQRISATVTLTASTQQYFDLALNLQNKYGDTLSYVDFPYGLTFPLADIQEVIYPLLPGVKLTRNFFTQKRSWIWYSYPSPLMFADYTYVTTGSGPLCMYLVLHEDMTPMVIKELHYQNTTDQGEVYRFQHRFELAISDGGQWTSPTMRISIGETVQQTVDNFRKDTDLETSPSIQQKLGPLYPSIATALSTKIDAINMLLTFNMKISDRDRYRQFINNQPKPSLFWVMGWSLRGFDENNPDYFPPDPKLGSEDDLLAMFQSMRDAGHLTMPYINLTWWDDESPTMQSLNPNEVAVLDRNKKPVYENFGEGGYVISPYPTAVRNRIKQVMQELQEKLKPDIVYEDQINRVGLDFNPSAPTTWAQGQGWLEHTRRYESMHLTSEGGYDRLVPTHVGFVTNMLIADLGTWGGFGWKEWGSGTYEYYPIVSMMARDKVLSYNLAQNFASSKYILSWSLATGQMLSWEFQIALVGSLWQHVSADFQKYVIGPYVHERIRNYTHVADSVTLTRFETHSIQVNWSKSNLYQIGEHTLSKEGCMVASDDGRLTAGIFTRFNGKDLSAGDHFLIVRQFTDSIVVHHPMGPTTKLSLTMPTNWGTNPDLHIYAFTNDVTSEVTKTVAGGIVEFDLEDYVNNGRVVRTTVAIGPVYITSPQLLLPTGDAVELSRAPLLSWNPVAGATGYSVEVALKSSFATVVYSRSVSQSNQVQLDTLGQGTTYFWRVRVVKGSSVGPWSETRRFRTAGNNLNDGLVAYFPLNGNADDYAGNGNNGTFRNGVLPAADRFGVAGRAYDFNGSNGYIEFSESPSLRAIEKEVSVAVWVKPRSYKQEAGVMLRDLYWNLLLTNGQATGLIFDENGNQNRIVGSQLAPLNTWSHIAFTYDDSTIRVYLNGQQTGELAFAARRIGRTDVLKNPTLGNGIGNNQHYFDGVIDEVFVYNRTLSNVELALLAQYQGLVAPTLQSPANGDTVVTRAPLLSWLTVADAATYHLQLSLNPGFSSFVFQDSTLTATSLKAPLLALDTTYYWRIRTTNGPITSDWSSVKSFKTSRTVTEVEKSPAIPKEFALLQNHPNPFNPATNIEFHIAAAGFVSLTVFDILGRQLATLVNEHLQPGSYKVKWDASHCSSGTYLYRLQSNGLIQTRSLLLLR
ncbi:MAG: LamG-like jellyroll fold domain-containing protein [Ignavibacteria bacterium]|nr:LamG-like jellyroll fold domain-containing protein [Ignavibacteria bacterium]